MCQPFLANFCLEHQLLGFIQLVESGTQTIKKNAVAKRKEYKAATLSQKTKLKDENEVTVT